MKKEFLFPQGNSERQTENLFRVQTEGAELIYRWLKVHDASAKELMSPPPNGNGEPLALGDIEFSPNDYLRGIISAASYHHEEMNYQLTSLFVGIITPTDLNPADLLGSLSREMSKRSEPPPLYLRDVYNKLSKLEAKGYLVSFDQEEQSISITAENNTFSFHYTGYEPTSGPGGNPFSPRSHVYRFHLKDSDIQEKSLDDFKKSYKLYGNLLEELTNIICSTHDIPTPEKPYLLKPPKNTDAKITKMERINVMNRNAMTTAGIIEDDGTGIEKQILIETPDVRFSDVGGHSEAKQHLQQIIESFRDPNKFKRWGAKPPRSAIFYGEPGTGKTLLAKALAGELGGKCYIVSVPDIIHWLVGKSENNLNLIFKKAKEESEKGNTVILFFDEFEALAQDREKGSPITSLVVSTLLNNLDGFKNRGDNVVVIAATNKPDQIDEAVRRAGRFDLEIKIGMPDIEARREIFKIHMKKAMETAMAEGDYLVFSKDIEIESLCRATEGYSGADIYEIVRRTLNEKVKLELEGKKPGLVTTNDILSQINSYERKKKNGKVGFLALREHRK